MNQSELMSEKRVQDIVRVASAAYEVSFIASWVDYEAKINR